MKGAKFAEFATVEGCKGWEKLIARPIPLYEREGETRSPFERDYTRILHSNAYRRLKHKTQVFFHTDNDHVCTRMEHVAHVGSVSESIAKALGLNCELTRAIALGHDLGHAPFGHYGERVLNEMSLRVLGERFWHERNGLRFADKIELLPDNQNVQRNLSLTYAVRDGIISHCGEVEQNGIRPRGEYIDLERDYLSPAQFQPATWEGCVVKISDKIAYVGRDIEDALSLGFLTDQQTEEIRYIIGEGKPLNTTVIIYQLICDIAENSSPERGIAFSEETAQKLALIKNFNYRYIYTNPRFESFERYAKLVLEEFFRILSKYYAGEDTVSELEGAKRYYPKLIGGFLEWLKKYTEGEEEGSEKFGNLKIYGRLENENIYDRAIIDYISGMTDSFAVNVFGELLSYS